MKLRLLEAAIASAFLALSTQGFTQSKGTDTFRHGESKRYATMTGADKDQCDKEEATKTEGPAAQEASKPQDSGLASAGASAAPAKPGDSFTHGESKRCAT